MVRAQQSAGSDEREACGSQLNSVDALSFQPVTPDGTRTADYDYDLPADRIAQSPSDERDASKLMIVHRHSRSYFGSMPAFHGEPYLFLSGLTHRSVLVA